MKDGLRTFGRRRGDRHRRRSGIRQAIAETLAARGSEVVLTDIDHADAAARRIRERGGRPPRVTST
jgi:NAD(P)-dependent dehydrogenase (short-subunit alcohol dehydrogenase family)